MQIPPTNQDQNEQKPRLGREPGRPGVAGAVVTTSCLFAALLLLIGYKAASASSGGSSAGSALPLVYGMENMGAKFPAPPLPAVGEAPFIQPLPDPFAWANDPLGKTRSTTFSDWERHRAEMIAEIEHYEIGTKPPRPENETASYSNNTLTVVVTVGTNTLTLTSRITLPAGNGPFPAIIGMNGSPNLRAAQMSQVAKISYSVAQVSAYGQAPSASHPYYKLYPELLGQSGQYSAWAWGVSRIIDGLELVQKDLPIDLKHIGVLGCSYAGKMALFSGALDERVALTFAQESGGGGDTAWRYSALIDAKAKTQNERVEGLQETDHKWFRPQMWQFAGTNVPYLPEDHHMLEALVAPRALFASGNTNYYWLSNPAAYVCDRATEKVYDTLGISDRYGFNLQGGHAHCATTPAIDQEMGAYIDKFLLGKTEVDTHVRDFPEDFNGIDAARWTAWWGTGAPVLPDAKTTMNDVAP
jgi:hypothetical protein